MSRQRYELRWLVGLILLMAFVVGNLRSIANDEKVRPQKSDTAKANKEVDGAAAKRDDEEESSARIHIKKMAEQCVFEFAEKPEGESAPFKMREEPLLRYGDPARDIGASELWTWMDEDVPAMFQKIEVNVHQGSNDKWTWCFSNGSSQKVKCGWPSVRTQTVTVDPVALQPVPGNPEVKTNPTALALSARQISRKFTSRGGENELRLMPRPLMEFKSEKKGISYGAVYGMASGTNPSVLLVLQAEKTDSGERWVFRGVHMTADKVFLLFDGNSVWEEPEQSPSKVSTWGYYFSFRDAHIK